ncbi:MAG: prepilin-type N-terminal cleavage/methylation domain-containing protein, partial [candidate division Zixibacteria bacterium]
MRAKRGLTLIELMVAGVMFAALAGTAIFLYSAVIRTWLFQDSRTALSIELDWKLEEISRDLREITDVQATAGFHEIRFSL